MLLWARDGDELTLLLPLLVTLVDVAVVDDVGGGEDELGAEFEEVALEEESEGVVVVDVAVFVEDKFSVPLVLIRSEIIVLLFTSQLLGEVGGEVEVGEAEAELELATELQLPVFLDKSVGSFSLAAAEAW